jgi:ABC-type nitrate/sulfonate/bicarbonate transport system permease component
MKPLGQRIIHLFTNTVVSLAVVAVLWFFALWAFNVQPFIGKNPFDVYAFLFEVPAASENRELVAVALGQTMIDASIGFVVGIFLATLVSLIFSLSRGIEQALMPIAMLLRSVPLIAMAPIIILIFGREQLSVAVMGAIVVLFPALVNIVFGLRSAPPAMFDLVAVYGGSKLDALRTVAFPSSLPSFFAALKISVPGAITGALLVEWLATGQGIGYAIVSAIGRARPSEVWTYVALITIVSIVLYNIVAMLEESVLAKYGHNTAKQSGK